jgi:hypothetical protein
MCAEECVGSINAINSRGTMDRRTIRVWGRGNKHRKVAEVSQGYSGVSISKSEGQVLKPP